jgi:predicted dehydrogenase
VIGYTQRFRRRFLTVKQRLRDGQIGEVTTVITRALMNRMVPEATLRKVGDEPGATTNLTPMVVSGTHSLDMCMWLMEGKEPVEVYARSVDRTLGPLGTKDGTVGVFTMDDGTVFSMSINWALPAVWPGAVYGLEIGIVGTEGVIDIEDTHRDVIVASEHAQPAGYTSRGFTPPAPRHIDFVGSYPPGDLSDGVLWGPMREETMTWFNRLTTGARTPHATAAEGHRNLLLTMAMDLSAQRGTPVPLPITPEELLA